MDYFIKILILIFYLIIKKVSIELWNIDGHCIGNKILIRRDAVLILAVLMSALNDTNKMNKEID